MYDRFFLLSFTDRLAEWAYHKLDNNTRLCYAVRHKRFVKSQISVDFTNEKGAFYYKLSTNRCLIAAGHRAYSFTHMMIIIVTYIFK